MGAGSTKFGVSTNPRVELADSQTRSLGKRMEIDTPSIIKLEHGTIRYREPEKHRHPVLPRIQKPTEVPHEGTERVGKCGYFYHPRLNDFSNDGKYTKEDASRFHYVQKTPQSAAGKKVFFVMGVGMPDELEPPPTPTPETIPEEMTVVEDLEKENDKENAQPEDDVVIVEETDLDTPDKPENENMEGITEQENIIPKSKLGSKTSVKTTTKEDKPPIEKEFRGPLIPRPNIPQVNELPVNPDRTRIICRTRNQLYYNMDFAEPVVVDQELTASRANLFLADSEVNKSKTDVKESENEDKTESVDKGITEETVGEKQQAENSPKTGNDFSIEVLADGSPPTLEVQFEKTLTVADLKKRLAVKLDTQSTKINVLHDDKYIISQQLLSGLYLGELQEGYRHRIILTPM